MLDRQLVLGNLLISLECLGFSEEQIEKIVKESDYWWDVVNDETMLLKAEEWNTKQNKNKKVEKA